MLMKFEYSFSLFAKHSKCVSFLVFGGFFFFNDYCTYFNRKKFLLEMQGHIHFKFFPMRTREMSQPLKYLFALQA